ncbi:MAG: adenosylcobalamin-dependent ribonucleoside-diphosphate reductase [Bacteroidales bacterium]|jgi:ribonucleoside-diphosphate reductase alpha chain|nr:adenosylcobalamin-dependent ribonucleoside-diphosphate reductase [Bacteroidales bacterium]
MDFLKDFFGTNTSKDEGNKLETEKYDKLSSKPDYKEEELLNARRKFRPSQPSPEREFNNETIDVKETIEVKKELIPQKNVHLETKKYTEEEVCAKAKEYFNGDEMVASVWTKKYALRDGEGNLLELTPDDMHRRIAREFARIERKYPNPLDEVTINHLLKKFQYLIPQGSPMFGIGNNFQIASLSNCFVIGLGENSDSYGSIMKIDEEQVQLMKRRGGVGHDLSHIRPEGSKVQNSALTSTGIVPFMDRYSNSTREVAQGGRRGALMLSISIKHPDVENFIDAKMTMGRITGANVSVKIDDEFMQCVKTGDPYMQQYPINSDNPTVKREINAGKLWNKIIHNAWRSAEPGVLFWSTIKKESIPDCYSEFGFGTVSTNPCGEIPLCPYDSCRLLAINLYSYVDNPFTKSATFNFEKFKSHVKIAQRLMDDLIDMEIEKIDTILQKVVSDPEEESIKQVERNLWQKIREKAIAGRRTGLGITAEGDMLAALNIRYGSEEAITFSVEVHKQLALAAYRSSVEMAKERGKFELYNTDNEKHNPFINRLREADPELYQEMTVHGRRNIALLTIAPTGSVSLCTQTSSGIEPTYDVIYNRRRKVNPNDKNVKIDFVDKNGDAFEKYRIIHPKFKTWVETNGYDVDLKQMEEKELNKLIEKSPYHKATAHDIDWLMKVRMQGCVQKWVDHSISVTVNLPEDITEDVVSDIYRTAWKNGCKGVTIYRAGSREGEVLGDDNKNTSGKENFIEHNAPKRPEKIEADVIRFQNNEEEWVAVVGLYDGKPYEIFTGRAGDFYLPPDIKKGWVLRVKQSPKKPARYDFIFVDKQGYEVIIQGLSRMFKAEYWDYAKLISGILRHGMPILYVVDLISKLRFGGENIMTWQSGVARVLKSYIKDGTKKGTCPSCSEGDLIYKENCPFCPNCGYTKC